MYYLLWRSWAPTVFPTLWFPRTARGSLPSSMTVCLGLHHWMTASQPEQLWSGPRSRRPYSLQTRLDWSGVEGWSLSKVMVDVLCGCGQQCMSSPAECFVWPPKLIALGDEEIKYFTHVELLSKARKEEQAKFSTSAKHRFMARNQLCKLPSKYVDSHQQLFLRLKKRQLRCSIVTKYFYPFPHQNPIYRIPTL